MPRRGDQPRNRHDPRRLTFRDQPPCSGGLAHFQRRITASRGDPAKELRHQELRSVRNSCVGARRSGVRSSQKSESGGGHFPAGFFASSRPAVPESLQRGRKKEYEFSDSAKKTISSTRVFYSARVSGSSYLRTVCSIVTGNRLAFLCPEAQTKVSQRTLTFAERVAYQRVIEDVYWHHRIWPKENRDPKPFARCGDVSGASGKQSRRLIPSWETWTEIHVPAVRFRSS